MITLLKVFYAYTDLIELAKQSISECNDLSFDWNSKQTSSVNLKRKQVNCIMQI